MDTRATTDENDPFLNAGFKHGKKWVEKMGQNATWGARTTGICNFLSRILSLASGGVRGWKRPLLANPFLANMCVSVVSQSVRPGRVGAEGWGPAGWGAQNFALSVPLPPPGLLFLSLIVCLFVCLFVDQSCSNMDFRAFQILTRLNTASRLVWLAPSSGPESAMADSLTSF